MATFSLVLGIKGLKKTLEYLDFTNEKMRPEEPMWLGSDHTLQINSRAVENKMDFDY